MKKLLTFTLLTLLLFSLPIQTIVKASDVDNHQMRTELNYWIGLGVIQPDKQGKYTPDKSVTRGEFASYIARALNLPNSTKYTFKDVKSNTVETIEIQNAAGAGILSGYPDGTFRPTEKITRQQMAAMMFKAMRHLELPVQTTTINFKDTNKISANFVDAVSVAVNLNIIRGDHRKDGVYFKPKDNATVAHAAAFLFRMFTAVEILKPQEPVEPSDPGIPNEPDVDPEVYKVSSISNGQVIPTTTLYRTYEDALIAYNASSTIQVIEKNNKIIKMKEGRVFGSENQKQVTVLYKNSNLQNEVTYVQKGREMKYIGSSQNHVIVEIAGNTYYAKQSEVDLIPTALVTGYDYYVADTNGLLIHYTYDNLKKIQPFYSVGPISPLMQAGKKYSSLDGVHFTEVGTNKVITYYPYFQFQSVRQPTSYTGAQLDYYVTEILRDRENTGLAKYKDATVKSKLIGIGEYLKTMEESSHINAMFILATAIHESDYGMSDKAQTINNLFGIKVFDSAPELGDIYTYPKKSIDAFVNDYMNLNYANPLGAYANGAVPGNKAVGFNVKYASDPNWGSKIAGHMWKIDTFLGHRDYKAADLARVTYLGSAGVNVRSTPDTSGLKLFTFKPRNNDANPAFGYPLVIVEETTGSDGFTWYKVLSDLNPPSDFGWIRADLVERITDR